MIRFVVIGITDSPKPFFPPEVLEIIKEGQVFSGGKRHHEIVKPFLPTDAEWIDITVPIDDVFCKYKSQVSARPEGIRCQRDARILKPQTIIVFASGDPLFFGFANTIRQRMPEAEVQVFPAFNSLQMLAHRLLLPYHDMCIVSLTGRPWPEFDRALIEHAPKIGILTDREHTPAAIARRMMDYGYTYYNMSIGEHLGNPSLEKVSVLTLEDAAKHDFGQPNCVILVNSEQFMENRYGYNPAKGCSAESNHNDSLFTHYHSLNRPFGLADSSFALLDGREKMITKMPIRLLTLQALDLAGRHVLWDIGFCTGSVSIEARLLFPHLHIEAFEVRPECEAIIHENARRHGAPGIGVHIGDFRSFCCDTIVTNGAPDAVFIGGHGGHLKDIMAKAKSYMQPGGIMVMNSVSSPVVDRLTDRPSSHQLFDEACHELDLIQHPPLHITLNDHNPIDILKCELPS